MMILVGLISFVTCQTLNSIRTEFSNVRADISRINECFAAVEAAPQSDAVNLDAWKLKYAENHGRLVFLGWGSISARIETTSVALQTVLEPVPVLNEKLDGMADS